jgi:hypothetical protein
MALTLVVDDDLDALLEKFARAKLQHPTEETREFLGHAVLFQFSMGDDEETPTLTLLAAGTHVWPYASEPARSFDDRGLA